MAYDRYDKTMTEVDYKEISSGTVLAHIKEKSIKEVEIKSSSSDGYGDISMMDRIKIAKNALRSEGYKVLSEGDEPDYRGPKGNGRHEDPKDNIENLEVDDSWETELVYTFTSPGYDGKKLEIRYIDLHEKDGGNEYDGLVLSYHDGAGPSDYAVYMKRV